MAWSFKIEGEYQVSGRGQVVSGHTTDLVVLGPATITAPDGTKTDVEVTGVETFASIYYGQRRPYGAVLRGKHMVIVDSWIASKE